MSKTTIRPERGNTPASQRWLVRGVSLIESCIALAIGALVLTGTASSMAQAIERFKLRAASAQLSADLRETRYLAISRSEPLRLSIWSRDGWSCYVVHTGPAGDCECTNLPADAPAHCTHGQALKTQVWPQGRSVALSSNVRSIVFDPVLGTSSPTGTLRLSSPSGLTYRHSVNLMGRVRVCVESASSGGLPTC
jgi:type IV fimbrial biogenesis protein FimT